MKKIILIFIILFGLNSIALADCTDKSSPYKCKKISIVDDDGNTSIDLTCTLPNMPTMPIIAKDVFKADGTLKTYWGRDEDVCDVLGWLEEGAKKFGDVGKKYSYASKSVGKSKFS